MDLNLRTATTEVDFWPESLLPWSRHEVLASRNSPVAIESERMSSVLLVATKVPDTTDPRRSDPWLHLGWPRRYRRWPGWSHRPVFVVPRYLSAASS